ncbi:hypothetical protein V5P93_007108 [Actinokineospora auranticolor]|uniref:CHAT domain-containing protein n=1 Tax=Actinokineospora auranticolor TaxID=155976 RepID=A0A2S6GGV9_9PSEU|nr:hypothetical protein [Actinokineospora auranticolor]PPK64443.1 hypothetical protein CLV40_1196 [Actinokineospora auranticolor]
MIEVALEPAGLAVGRETELFVRLRNPGPGTCTNVLVKLRFPHQVQLLRGPAWVEEFRLGPGQEVVRKVLVRATEPGRWHARAVNFTYRDRFGDSRYVDDLSLELRATEPEPAAAEPAWRATLRTEAVRVSTWDNLCGRVDNVGDCALDGVEVRVEGPFRHDGPQWRRLPPIEVGGHGSFEVPVHVTDTGALPVRVRTRVAAAGRVWRDEQEFKVNAGQPRAETADEPVRILFLNASPDNDDVPVLDWEGEYNAIRHELRLSRQRDRFALDSRVAVTSVELMRAVRDARPSLVHFSGHGYADGDLLLENPSGGAVRVPAEGVARLFRAHADVIGGVVVNACHSEPLARAVSTRIGFAVGLAGRVNDRLAIDFSTGFYMAYAAGDGVEAAFESGLTLMAMHPYHSAESDLPRLYVGGQRAR